MKIQWQNDNAEAWLLDGTGTLMIRRKVPVVEPVDGFYYIYVVDCLLPLQLEKAT